jgi:excisionase family DNA binding protein
VKRSRRGTNAVGPKPTTRRRGFSVAEVAEMFGACEMTVRRAIKAGELHAFRLRGKILVPAEVVEAMATAGQPHDSGASERRPEGGAA